MHQSVSQYYGKSTSAARGITDQNASAVGMDDLCGDAQPQSEMPFFTSCPVGPVEAFKDLLLFTVGDADAVIRHLIFHSFPIGYKRKPDTSALRRVAERMVQQDRQDLSDPLRITDDRRDGLLRKPDEKADRPFRRHRFKGFKGIQKQSVQFCRFLPDRPAVVSCSGQ